MNNITNELLKGAISQFNKPEVIAKYLGYTYPSLIQEGIFQKEYKLVRDDDRTQLEMMTFKGQPIAGFTANGAKKYSTSEIGEYSSEVFNITNITHEKELLAEHITAWSKVQSFSLEGAGTNPINMLKEPTTHLAQAVSNAHDMLLALGEKETSALRGNSKKDLSDKYKIKGLFNNDRISEIKASDSGVGSSRAFADKTAEQIQADLISVFDQQRAVVKGDSSALATHIFLPPRLLSVMKIKKFANSSESVAKEFQESYNMKALDIMADSEIEDQILICNPSSINACYITQVGDAQLSTKVDELYGGVKFTIKSKTAGLVIKRPSAFYKLTF